MRTTATNKNGTSLHASLNSGPNINPEIGLTNISKREHPESSTKLYKLYIFEKKRILSFLLCSLKAEISQA
jgi:hypothetical protein